MLISDPLTMAAMADAVSLTSTVDGMSDTFGSSMDLRDDISSVGSDSEYDGAAPYRRTDRYGFIGRGNADGSSGQLSLELLRRREMKWLDMTMHWEKTMSRRYKKVKLLCRKGIPSSLRARCWPMLCGGQAHMDRHPQIYQDLDRAPGERQWIETIEKDIHRQFPFHEMFLSPEGHGQQGLLRVLKAYTVYRPEEGYCQAQGPIAAMLLMQMPVEQAFWCLVQICDKYLPGYYSPEMEAVLLDGEVFVALLKKVCPVAYKHLKKHSIGPLLYVTEWFLCLFTRTLPFPTVLRIWDAFLSEGVKVLFRVGLVLVRLALGSSEKLKQCGGLVETLEKMRTIPPQLLREDVLIPEVHNLAVSDRDIQKTCLAQLSKMKKSNPEFKFHPGTRLYGAKAIFDDQQLREAQRLDIVVPTPLGLAIPTIVVEEVTLRKTKVERKSEREEMKEQKRREAVHQQEVKRLEVEARKSRKKPATRAETFHVQCKSLAPECQEQQPSSSLKRNSGPY
ncbi:carabin [Ambystoma mexicanum]|uniref:carabin n=1 Tax=Ambystoma mexicanum TaxID=8296 RepID=UPI0037E7EDB7